MLGQKALEQLADDVLIYIRSRSDKSRDIRKLAGRFKVDRGEIDAALNILERWGYRLKRTRSTVRFVAPPDLITATEIAWRLKTKWLGKNIHAYQSVKSTNDLAASLADAGAAEGTIVTSEEQTRGRGRFARVWHSPSGKNIYVSIVMRPTFPPEQAPGMSIMAAVALAEALEQYCPGKVQIKWPNDVLIRGRKTAGILTELSAERERIQHVVIGVGINVNLTADELPVELLATATSVRRATRKKTDRVALLQSFLFHLEKRYEQYCRSGLKSMHRFVRQHSSLIGHEVRLFSGRRITSGLARDIDQNGSLIIETPAGILAVTSGEVSIAKE